nr:immunoglobulin light chain junction region [Macaca mulatta]MOV37728.1 immunoglobulin light chain junction region [Macaca mulatta]
CQKYSTPPWTF